MDVPAFNAMTNGAALGDCVIDSARPGGEVPDAPAAAVNGR